MFEAKTPRCVFIMACWVESLADEDPNCRLLKTGSSFAL